MLSFSLDLLPVELVAAARKNTDEETTSLARPQDEGWMAHSLKFRKDATMDRRASLALLLRSSSPCAPRPSLTLSPSPPSPSFPARPPRPHADTADEYELVDPLAKNALTLDEIRAKADSGRRRYPGERDEGRGRGEGSSSRGGGGGGGGGGRERYDGAGRGGGERYGGGGGGGRDGGFGGSRGERAQGNWKQDRVSTMDLA